MNWFVSAQNQIYGPYSNAEMQGFVSEGRVNGQSLISNAPAQGFFPASGYDIFSLWAGSGQIAVGGTYHTQAPQVDAYSVIPEAPSEYVQIEAINSNTHIFIIMAEIRSENTAPFLQTLQTFGTTQRIGDTTWLLQSAYLAEQIRNTLSQILTRQDRLFILDSTSNTPAWFNIGADLDHRIRELFDENDE